MKRPFSQVVARTYRQLYISTSISDVNYNLSHFERDK